MCRMKFGHMVYNIHGTDAKYVAHQQADWRIDRLKATAVEAQLVSLKGDGHGFKGPDAVNADRTMPAFFAKHLKTGSH